MASLIACPHCGVRPKEEFSIRGDAAPVRPAADVPASDAAWDARTCAALIVQDVQADGHASIIYILGPEGSESTVSGAVLHGTGVVRDGELRFQNSDGSQYAFRPGLVDMVGHWVDPKGESFQATFKATP